MYLLREYSTTAQPLSFSSAQRARQGLSEVEAGEMEEGQNKAEVGVFFQGGRHVTSWELSCRMNEVKAGEGDAERSQTIGGPS